MLGWLKCLPHTAVVVMLLFFVGCSSLPAPGELAAGLFCVALEPLAPEPKTVDSRSPPLQEAGAQNAPRPGGHRVTASHELPWLVMPREECPVVRRPPEAAVRPLPTIASNTAQTDGAPQPSVLPLSDPTMDPDHKTENNRPEEPPVSRVIEPPDARAARIQLDGLWSEYRHFRYEDVVRHGSALLSSGAGTAEQRAMACILAGAASYILGRPSETEAYLHKAVDLDSGLAPDPNLFPSAVCELHRAASARSGL